MKNILLPLLLLLSSCEGVVKFIDNENYNQLVDVKTNSPFFNIVFSHNIRGETHPCGCRHFPLGGLPQAAYVFSELKKEKDVLYVDTGDSLFPSSNVPESVKVSLGFGAENLARGLKQLGLKFVVPGEQDMAMGTAPYKKSIKENQFQVEHRRSKGSN